MTFAYLLCSKNYFFQTKNVTFFGYTPPPIQEVAKKKHTFFTTLNFPYIYNIYIRLKPDLSRTQTGHKSDFQGTIEKNKALIGKIWKSEALKSGVEPWEIRLADTHIFTSSSLGQISAFPRKNK